MMIRLKNHRQREQRTARQQRECNQLPNSFAEVHPFENHAQHNHEHGEPDPVGVSIYLANIIVLGFAVLLERRLGPPEIPAGGCAKGLGE